MLDNISIVILAAGKGTRMKSDLPKVMHKVASREMLNLVIDQAKILNPKQIVIVVSEEMQNFQEKILQSHPKTQISFALQKDRKGTANALDVGLKNFKNFGDKLLILYGDTPLASFGVMKKMIEKLNDYSICVLGFEDKGLNQYGRLIVDNKDFLKKIVEFKDADEDQRKISLCNSGLIAVDGEQIKKLLSQVSNDNVAQEFYLTDIVDIAFKNNLKCGFIKTSKEEVLGVNSRTELAMIENIKQNQLRQKFMESGVTMLDPASVFFSFDTKIASDVLIHPQVFFGLGVEIEKNVEIKSFCHIEGTKIGNGAVIGPFARLRPETEIGNGVKIGNFVEIKKSQIEANSKVGHLSYIGDAEIGKDTNIGAGTITCNFDGYKKFKTKIGKNVFVGSNSALIAPVKIGDGALIAAGSVITKDVQKDELGVCRLEQKNIKNGGKNYHKKRL